MVKIPRKIGIAMVVTSVLLFGACAYGVSQIKFENVKTEMKSFVAPLQDIGPVILNEQLADEFLKFEYQFLMGEYHSNKKEYDKANTYYAQAVNSAKASIGDHSLFTFIAYESEARSEIKNRQNDEALEHFKAALKALPDREENETFKWRTESWIVSAFRNISAPEHIPFYREHLALTSKLLNTYTTHKDLVYALYLLGQALDHDGKLEESEPVWKRALAEVHTAKYSSDELTRWILQFAKHEAWAGNWTDAERAIEEASKLSAQTKDDKLLSQFLGMNGTLYLQQKDPDKAEKIFQECLVRAKKTNDKAQLFRTYDWLSEVALLRHDIAKRLEYSTDAFKLADKEGQKFERLPKLAILARLNNEIGLARDYASQWKLINGKEAELPTTITRITMIDRNDLDSLLALYPNVHIADIRKIKFDTRRFSGYEVNTKQLNTLMDAI